MLTTGQVTDFFGTKQRRVFQIVETKQVHFIEIENGTVMICIKSLSHFLDSEGQENQILKRN